MLGASDSGFVAACVAEAVPGIPSRTTFSADYDGFICTGSHRLLRFADFVDGHRNARVRLDMAFDVMVEERDFGAEEVYPRFVIQRDAATSHLDIAVAEEGNGACSVRCRPIASRFAGVSHDGLIDARWCEGDGAQWVSTVHAGRVAAFLLARADWALAYGLGTQLARLVGAVREPGDWRQDWLYGSESSRLGEDWWPSLRETLAGRLCPDVGAFVDFVGERTAALIRAEATAEANAGSDLMGVRWDGTVLRQKSGRMFYEGFDPDLRSASPQWLLDGLQLVNVASASLPAPGWQLSGDQAVLLIRKEAEDRHGTGVSHLAHSLANLHCQRQIDHAERLALATLRSDGKTAPFERPLSDVRLADRLHPETMLEIGEGVRRLSLPVRNGCVFIPLLPYELDSSGAVRVQGGRPVRRNVEAMFREGFSVTDAKVFVWVPSARSDERSYPFDAPALGGIRPVIGVVVRAESVVNDPQLALFAQEAYSSRALAQQAVVERYERGQASKAAGPGRDRLRGRENERER